MQRWVVHANSIKGMRLKPRTSASCYMGKVQEHLFKNFGDQTDESVPARSMISVIVTTLYLHFVCTDFISFYRAKDIY